jgi:hypothetical protein
LKKSTRFSWIEISILCVLIFLFRLYATIPVEGSGDSFVKWYEAKRLYHGLQYSRLDHHTMRWGINFLSLFFQKMFGTSPSVYYLAPATAATAAAFFLYKIALNIQGRLLAMCAVLLFTFHPIIINAGTQLFPGIFSICYVLGSIYFLLAYTENRRIPYLVCSSLFLFMAYGAKITNLFFLPAIVFYFVFTLKEYKSVILYLGILFLGFCVETVWIDTILGDYSLPGRLALAGGHLNLMQSDFAKESFVSGIIDRWRILPNYLYLQSFTGFIASFFFLSNRKKYPKESFIAFAYVGVAFLITFGICSLDPVHFLLPNRPRYLNVTIPLSLLLTLRLASIAHNYKYVITTFLLFAVPYPNTINHLIQSSSHRQFYKINGYATRISAFLKEGYCLAFFSEKHARLYRAMFVDDNFSMDLNEKQTARIYIVPAKSTEFNALGTMYLLTLNHNIPPKGIVGPYPKEYVLSVHPFSQKKLTFAPDWEQVW